MYFELLKRKPKALAIVYHLMGTEIKAISLNKTVGHTQNTKYMGRDLGKPGLITTFSNFTFQQFQLPIYVMIQHANVVTSLSPVLSDRGRYVYEPS